jgi:hypothetical protein
VEEEKNGGQMSTIDLKCSKCGALFQIHEPAIVGAMNEYITQVSIVPTWSIDERLCQSCGTFYGPVIKKPEVVWVPMEKPKQMEEKRILIPNLNMPTDLRA